VHLSGESFGIRANLEYALQSIYNGHLYSGGRHMGKRYLLPPNQKGICSDSWAEFLIEMAENDSWQTRSAYNLITEGKSRNGA